MATDCDIGRSIDMDDMPHYIYKVDVIIVGEKCAINIYKMRKHQVKFAYFVLHLSLLILCAQHISKFCWSIIITILYTESTVVHVVKLLSIWCQEYTNHAIMHPNKVNQQVNNCCPMLYLF